MILNQCIDASALTNQWITTKCRLLHKPPIPIVEFKRQVQNSTTFLKTESKIEHLVQRECPKINF